MYPPLLLPARWTLQHVLKRDGSTPQVLVLGGVPEGGGPSEPGGAGERFYSMRERLEHDRIVYRAEAMRAVEDEACGRLLLPTGSMVIVKAFSKGEKGTIERLWPELNALAQVAGLMPGQSHLVGLIEAYEDAEWVYVLTPYMAGGDLYAVLEAKGSGLSPIIAKRYFAQVVCGLRVLRQKLGSSHGDLSLENVVLSGSQGGEEEEQDAYLIDMGSSCSPGPDGLCDGAAYTYRGKLSYMPPEVAFGHPALPIDPFAVDAWQLGVLLYTMLTARPLYSDTSEIAYGWLQAGKAGDLVERYKDFGLEVDAHAKDLICQLLKPDPAQRPTLEQIAQHTWLAQAQADSE